MKGIREMAMTPEEEEDNFGNQFLGQENNYDNNIGIGDNPYDNPYDNYNNDYNNNDNFDYGTEKEKKETYNNYLEERKKQTEITIFIEEKFLTLKEKFLDYGTELKKREAIAKKIAQTRIKNILAKKYTTNYYLINDSYEIDGLKNSIEVTTNITIKSKSNAKSKTK